MRFRVLGPVRFCPRTPAAAKPRAVLATLLVRAGSVVSSEALIDELWADGPPRTASSTLHVYICHVRKALAEGGVGRPLVSRAPGYVLDVERDDVDLHLFEELSERGRGALRDEDFAGASRDLADALALWSGPALSGVPQGVILRSAATRLEEQRLCVLEQRIAADLKLGRHRELTGELMELAVAHPLRERLHCQLIVALHRSGRPSDALRAYRAVRRSLHDELGIGPGPALNRLRDHVLSAAGSVPASAGAHRRGPVSRAHRRTS
ncbi:AfsR/SARP family transcriptional regulator [Streptomyces sp. NBC_00287]|uniref:AfsR/SARP family transcriptional regulator n=1 Tax=Streptomyces sp. NBC_00287 TaxID=2975702 RepID=UPI002E2A39ED|nr:AfsR/SARP family transcriptional regulator [Streptomyces sp. NBC_00287]